MIRTIELPQDDIPRKPMADRQATALIESAFETMTEIQQRRVMDYMDNWCAGGKTMWLSDVEFMLHFLATGEFMAVEYV